MSFFFCWFYPKPYRQARFFLTVLDKTVFFLSLAIFSIANYRYVMMSF